MTASLASASPAPRSSRCRRATSPARRLPGTVRLDANENPFAALVAGQAGINRYPEPQPHALRQRLADLYGVAPEQLVGRARQRRRDRPADPRLLPPGHRQHRHRRADLFGAYAQFARVQGAGVITARLTDDFAFDADAVLATIGDAAPKLLFLCTPNNPTGTRDRPRRRAPHRRRAARHDGRRRRGLWRIHRRAELRRRGQRATSSSCAPCRRPMAWPGRGSAARSPIREMIDLIARVSPPYPLPTPSIAAALDALGPERMPVHAERIARLLADARPARRRNWPRRRDRARPRRRQFPVPRSRRSRRPRAPPRRRRGARPLPPQRRARRGARHRRHRGRESRPARRVRHCRATSPPRAAPRSSATPRKRGSRWRSTSTAPSRARSTAASPSTTTCSTRSRRMAGSA